MGFIPIVAGAASVFSSISGYSQQRRAASAQAAGINANRQAAEADAANRRAQIAAQRSFTDNQVSLNNLQRMLAATQFQAGAQAQNILSQMKFQQTQLDAKLANQVLRAQATEARGQLLAQSVQADIDEMTKVGNASMQAGTAQEQLRAQLLQAGAEATEGDRKYSAYQAMQAAAGVGEGRTTMSQDSAFNRQLAQQLLGVNFDAMSKDQQVRVQLAFEKGMADIVNKLQQAGIQGARDRITFNVQQGNQQYIDTVANAVLTGEADMNALRASDVQFRMGLESDRMTDEFNKLYSDQGLQMQSNAVNTALGAQRASLQAQAASVQRPSFLQMLPGLIQTGAQFINVGAPPNTNPLAQQQGVSPYSMYQGGTLPTYSGNPNVDTSGGFRSSPFVSPNLLGG